MTRTIAVLALLSGVVYLAWRLVATRNPAAPVLSWALLLLEIHGFLSFALFVHTTWCVDHVQPPPPVHDTSLRVAILITTYNEDAEVLLPTVAAAVALESFHQTWVLDDGRRDWVRAMAESLGASYLARKDGKHAKAGNLNNAMARIDADVFAILDADHVPRPGFLTNTLGYFHRDKGLALVQTPQNFYNDDSFAHGTDGFQEEALFYHVIQPGKNRWNAAFWCGTSALVRAESLRSAGGVSTDSVTEDAHTTIRLHRDGWNTVFHDEVLARGVAPATYHEFRVQRERWGAGAMQILRDERFLTRPGLTPNQRLSYIFTFGGWFESWRMLGLLLMPILVLLSGQFPIAASMKMFAVIYPTTFVLQQYALVRLGRGKVSLRQSLIFEAVRLPSSLLATIKLFVPGVGRFKVTPKGRTGDSRSIADIPKLLLALVAADIFAVAWGLATLAGATAMHYTSVGATFISMFFVLIGMWIVLAAIARIRATRFGSERRRSFRVEDEIPARIDGRPCVIESIGMAGGRIRIPREHVRGAPLAVLDTPFGRDGTRFAVDVTRTSMVGDNAQIAFDWAPDQWPQLATLARLLMWRRLRPPAEKPTVDRPRALPAPRN